MKLGRGSSTHFCILAAIFQDGFDAAACDRAIDVLRYSLGKPASYEFHFSHCPDSIRTAFLRCVAAERFSYHAFVIEKKRLFSGKFNNARDFYEFAATIVCDNAGDLMRNGKAVIDSNGDREFLRRLQGRLKQLVNTEGVPIIKRVKMENSKSNNLVQLADMACGAVARSITTGNHGYRNLLKGKGREQRVQCWPK